MMNNSKNRDLSSNKIMPNSDERDTRFQAAKTDLADKINTGPASEEKNSPVGKIFDKIRKKHMKAKNAKMIKSTTEAKFNTVEDDRQINEKQGTLSPGSAIFDSLSRFNVKQDSPRGSSETGHSSSKL